MPCVAKQRSILVDQALTSVTTNSASLPVKTTKASPWFTSHHSIYASIPIACWNGWNSVYTTAAGY
jgi:hypothetical protein